MTMTRNKFNNIDEYIAVFPKESQKIPEQICKIIKKTSPDAVETIKYSMPTFTLKENLVPFATFKNHIGLYPALSGDEAFNKELSVHRGLKGSVRFPPDKPMPLNLITKIVKFRVSETLGKLNTKRKRNDK